MSQTIRTCKKKIIIIMYIQWEIRRHKSTSLFQITAGYNQWCPRLHHKRYTVQAIPSILTIQAIPSIHTEQAIPSINTVQAIPSKRRKGALEDKVVGALEEKAVDLKGRKIEGGKTKEKDIMKRRQEGGEEEKKMGTEEKERRRSR